MKYIIITIVAIFSPFGIFAQKDTLNKKLTAAHHVYGDVGTEPGFSLTYNYNPTKHWGLGAGIQGGLRKPWYAEDKRFRPGIFGDVRFIVRPKKRGQVLSFLDAGLDFCKRDKRYLRDSITVYDLSYNNGFSSGLGVGYMRRITKRGGGIYVTLKLVVDVWKVRYYSFISDDKNGVTTWSDGNAVLSIGFKF